MLRNKTIYLNVDFIFAIDFAYFVSV